MVKIYKVYDDKKYDESFNGEEEIIIYGTVKEIKEILNQYDEDLPTFEFNEEKDDWEEKLKELGFEKRVVYDKPLEKIEDDFITIYVVKDAQGDDFTPFYADVDGIIEFIQQLAEGDPNYEFTNEDSWVEGLEHFGLTFEEVFSENKENIEK